MIKFTKSSEMDKKTTMRVAEPVRDFYKNQRVADESFEDYFIRIDPLLREHLEKKGFIEFEEQEYSLKGKIRFDLKEVEVNALEKFKEFLLSGELEETTPQTSGLGHSMFVVKTEELQTFRVIFTDEPFVQVFPRPIVGKSDRDVHSRQLSIYRIIVGQFTDFFSEHGLEIEEPIIQSGSLEIVSKGKLETALELHERISREEIKGVST